MKKSFFVKSFFLFVFLFWPLIVSATTYYVDASRPDDTGDGKSWQTAKKTIKAGLDLLSKTGDILEISGGTSGKIYREMIEIRKDGGPSYYTIRGSSESGHNGIVTIANYGSSWVNIWIRSGSQRIKIENLHIETDNDNDFAIYIYYSNYIQINNCKFSGTSNNKGEYACIQGMGNTGSGKYIEIRNNIISAYFDVGIDLNNDGDREDKYNLIEGNTVSGFKYCGIKIRKNQRTIIKGNYIYGPRENCADTKIFLLRNSHYNHIYNNIGEFTNIGYQYQHYIELRGFTGCGSQGDAQSSYNFIVNNTFTYTQGNNPKNAILFADDSRNNIFQNNIFQGEFTYFMDCWDTICPRPNQELRNNIITGFVTNWNYPSCTGTTFSMIQNKTSTSPNWKQSGNKPSPYYNITVSQDGSSASGNGFSPPLEDYDGYKRESPPDIGAFEYRENNDLPPNPPKNLKIVQ